MRCIITHDPHLIRNVTKQYLTKALIIKALGLYGDTLQYIDIDIQTPELCYIAVKQTGFALKFVKDEYKTYELCLMAVKDNGYAL